MKESFLVRCKYLIRIDAPTFNIQSLINFACNFSVIVTATYIVDYKKWQHFRRELVNLSTLFVPWQLRIKEIESHFGSVVASYFTFLRWLFWVNIVLAFTLSTFVILPEVRIIYSCSHVCDGPIKIALTFISLSRTHAHNSFLHHSMKVKEIIEKLC